MKTVIIKNELEYILKTYKCVINEQIVIKCLKKAANIEIAFWAKYFLGRNLSSHLINYFQFNVTQEGKLKYKSWSAIKVFLIKVIKGQYKVFLILITPTTMGSVLKNV